MVNKSQKNDILLITLILLFFVFVILCNTTGIEKYSSCDKYAYPNGCETNDTEDCKWRY